MKVFVIYPHELENFAKGGKDNQFVRNVIGECLIKHLDPIFFFHTSAKKNETALIEDTEKLVIQSCDKVMLSYDGKLTPRMANQLMIATGASKEIVRYP